MVVVKTLEAANAHHIHMCRCSKAIKGGLSGKRKRRRRAYELLIWWVNWANIILFPALLRRSTQNGHAASMADIEEAT